MSAEFACFRLLRPCPRARFAGWPLLLALLAMPSLLLVLSGSAWAAGQMRIGPGATVDTGSGQIALGCAALDLSGRAEGRWVGIDSVTLGHAATLIPDRLAFGGNWTSAGSARVPGLVAWTDACGRSPASMLGSNDFDRLEIHSPTGLERRFDAAGAQRTRLALSVVGGQQRVQLRSTGPSAAIFTLDAGATQQIARVDVRDLDASGGQLIAPGRPGDFDSIDSGNNSNWFFDLVAIPVPTLGFGGLLLMAGLLLFLARRRLSGGLGFKH